VEIDPHAPVQSHHLIRINASLERIWSLISDINHWSSWNTTIKGTEFDGGLMPGNTFKWRSGGTTIVSTIQTVEPLHRLGWTGKSLGSVARHVWVLEPAENDVKVITEESFSGWMARLMKGPLQLLLDKSLQAWLINLKKEAENRS
jgi:hypothetical protein